MKKVFGLVLMAFIFLLTDYSSVTAKAESLDKDGTLSETFDLELLEKQETTIDLPNGEELVVGIEPVNEVVPFADYTASVGTHAWRVYYDTGTLASEFYATIYVPKSGYSQITKVYGERPIRIIGGTVQKEFLDHTRPKETSTLPALASYRIQTKWFSIGSSDWGSSNPTLILKVKGKKVTTEAKGFYF